MYTYIIKHTRTLYLYDHIYETKLVDLKIEEVTKGSSPIMNMTPTKKIALLNREINPEKYNQPCRVEDFNLVERIHHKKSNQLS
jgi:hypothetical protein